MGSADIVPGVSGGTVALVLGIYDRLITNISLGARGLKQLLTGDFGNFRVTLTEIEWVWLVSLLVGILAAIVALASLIERLLHDQPVRMAALFLGLIIGSIWVAGSMIDRFDAVTVAIMLGVGAAMFLLLGLRTDTEVADDAIEVVTKSPLAFFLAGAIAICAMILPGISGSFILVMLGMYTEVLGAVNDRDLAPLIAFMVGAVAGLALFSTLLHWLLEKYHNWVMALMVGLMLGSTRVLWAWPNGTNTTTLGAPSGDVLFPLVLTLVGAVLVIGVSQLSRHLAGADPEKVASSIPS
jgi:putative membrane protein